MTSFSIFDNCKERNKFSSGTKNNLSFHNNDLIQRIPKLNLQKILNIEKNININPKSRNGKIAIDKQPLISVNNNIDKSNINSDNDDEKKYETDNNTPIKCHNNIYLIIMILINVMPIIVHPLNQKIFHQIQILKVVKNI